MWVTEGSHPGCLAPEYELSLIPERGMLLSSLHCGTQTPPMSAHPDNVVDTVHIRVTHVDADGTQCEAILLARALNGDGRTEPTDSG